MDTFTDIVGTVCAIFAAACFAAALAGYLHGQDLKRERERRRLLNDAEERAAFAEEGF